MVLFVAVAIGLTIGLISGGSFAGFTAAATRFRYLPVMFVAALIQVLIFTEPVGTWEIVQQTGAALYLLSIAMTLFFLLMNRHIPGLKIILLGALLNALVIAANGGYMPSPASALREAGRIDRVVADEPDEELVHTNSVVADEDAALIFDRETPLLILGDIIPLPDEMPLANVISIGDILIALGAGVAVVRVMHYRPEDEDNVPQPSGAHAEPRS